MKFRDGSVVAIQMSSIRSSILRLLGIPDTFCFMFHTCSKTLGLKLQTTLTGIGKGEGNSD